jgi:hypothetical protein
MKYPGKSGLERPWQRNVKRATGLDFAAPKPQKQRREYWRE